MLLDLAAVARERIATVRAGKRLLDEGGEAAEAVVSAKLAAEEAAAVDSFIVRSFSCSACAYDESSVVLRTAMLNPQVPGIEAMDFARISEAHRGRAQLYRAVSTLLADPPGQTPSLSPTEQNAASLLQMRHMRSRAKLSLGQQLRQARPTLLPGQGRPSGDACCCCDDESPVATPSLGARAKARASAPRPASDASCSSSPGRSVADGYLQRAAQKSSPDEPRGQRLEELINELFRMHDLNGNGVLEEKELIKLNENIAILHGSEIDVVDKAAVKSKFRTLFREKLDPEGFPVSKDVFRKYLLELLGELDAHEEAQEMIAEQFVAEAMTARAMFQPESVRTPEDAQRLALLRVPSFSSASTEFSFSNGSPC